MIAYHPQCPHCKTIVGEVKSLAKKVKENKMKVNIIALNLSRITWDQVAELKIEYFPTLRLYKQGGEIVNFENDSKSQTIFEFLKKNGIN